MYGNYQQQEQEQQQQQSGAAANTSSEGPLLTADTSTVRPEDLGSVFQRFNNYGEPRKTSKPRPPTSFDAQTGHRQSRGASRNNAALTRNDRMSAPSQQITDDGRIRHHYYRQYHHEESMAMPSAAAAAAASKQQQQHLQQKQQQQRHEKELYMIENATAAAAVDAAHRFGNIQSPQSRNRLPQRHDDESPTRRRLRLLLEGGVNRGAGGDGADDDDELYYDDERNQKTKEEEVEEQANSFRRTIIIVVVVCLIAAVGIIVLLAKSGDGNPIQGLKRLFAMATSSNTAEKKNSGNKNGVADGDGSGYLSAAPWSKRAEDEKDAENDLLSPSLGGLLPDGSVQQQEEDWEQQQQQRREQWEQQQRQQEQQQSLAEQQWRYENEIGDSNERGSVEGTPIVLPPTAGAVASAAAFASAVAESEGISVGPAVATAGFHQPVVRPVPQPSGGYSDSIMRGPASLVPGGENRSRPDMSREIPNLGADMRNIYGSSSSKTTTSLLGEEGRLLYETAGGGAAAERFLGMKESLPYDPATDTTLNQAENAKKTMMSLYNSHQKKIDPSSTVLEQKQQSGARPQRRADTQPIQQIRSADTESFGAAQQHRKQIAAKSQVAVSDIYNKKQMQRSATSSSSAAFVHDPAANNGAEFMDIHSQTYLGDK